MTYKVELCLCNIWPQAQGCAHKYALSDKQPLCSVFNCSQGNCDCVSIWVQSKCQCFCIIRCIPRHLYDKSLRRGKAVGPSQPDTLLLKQYQIRAKRTHAPLWDESEMEFHFPVRVKGQCVCIDEQSTNQTCLRSYKVYQLISYFLPLR